MVCSGALNVEAIQSMLSFSTMSCPPTVLFLGAARARPYWCPRAADDICQLWPYVRLVLWYTRISTRRAEYLQYLGKEIRGKFESYHDITPSALASLPILHACREESLRLLPSNNTGLRRISPGAIIDGHYIPKEVSSPSCSPG